MVTKKSKIRPKSSVILFLLSLASLFFLGFIWYQLSNYQNLVSSPKPVKVATQSAFAKAITEEKEKRLQEQKRQEAEKQYMAANGPCFYLPILMYHHIDNINGWLYVDPATFALQMDYLNTKGYRVISLNEAVANLSTGKNPGKVVVLTFDDGYRDFYTQAFPILRQHGFPSTVFVITQLMDGGDYLTWEQAREMAGTGLVTIGNHTLDHKNLSSLSADQIKNEVFASKSIIEGKIGKSINTFCYPYGDFNQTTINLVNEAGFVAATTTQSGIQCTKQTLALRRIRIGRGSLSNYGL